MMEVHLLMLNVPAAGADTASTHAATADNKEALDIHMRVAPFKQHIMHSPHLQVWQVTALGC